MWVFLDSKMVVKEILYSLVLENYSLNYVLDLYYLIFLKL